ncbi:MAG TPA: hypothetical protein VEH10_05900, partial [Thermoplasmata archaeon]|nr:hypothetical protein [Thermoplasmata archaeon]
GGDPKAKALLEIALGELEDRRRADPFLRHFETFRDLWQRTSIAAASPPASAPNASVKVPRVPAGRSRR